MQLFLFCRRSNNFEIIDFHKYTSLRESLKVTLAIHRPVVIAN